MTAGGEGQSKLVGCLPAGAVCGCAEWALAAGSCCALAGSLWCDFVCPWSFRDFLEEAACLDLLGIT